jgi:hypothetical protein
MNRANNRSNSDRRIHPSRLGQEARPPEVDMFAQTFSVAGEKQEEAADEATAILLKRFEGNPDVEKAKVDFDRAQKVEERFHQDFDGQDFTIR